MLLDKQGVIGSLLEVEFEEVARLVAAEETLNEDAGAVALKAPLKAVDVHFKVEFVLLGTGLVTVVSNVPFHVLVEPTETVTERCILDSLLVRYHVVVKGFQAGDRVRYKVTVARDGTDGVGEEGYVHDVGQRDERLQVLPLADVIVVQIQELQTGQPCKDCSRW